MGVSASALPAFSRQVSWPELSSAASSAKSTQSKPAATATTETTQPTTQNAAATGVEKDAAQAADAQFQSITYSSRTEKISLAVQMKQAAAKGAQAAGGSESGSSSAEQLTFSFFGEVREEAAALFAERTSAVADGLGGEQRSTYVAMSQQISARFSGSISFSGEALDGFATSSESLADGLSSDFDAFLGMVGDLLGSEDDITAQILEIFGGFFKGTDNAQDASSPFRKLLEEAYGLLSSAGGQQGATQGTNGTQTTATKSGSIQLEFSFEMSISMSVQMQQGVVQESDPIIFDLDGDGAELTNYANGAQFDITGSGQTVNTAFVTGGDAFMAIDRNGNGTIDDGTELFGDQNGASNGFEELRKLDSNGDRVINAKDSGFEKLMLFRDNGNGKTESGELISLKDAGIAEIGLDYKNVNQNASGGNRITQTSYFRRTDGSQGFAADAVLNFTV